MTTPSEIRYTGRKCEIASVSDSTLEWTVSNAILHLACNYPIVLTKDWRCSEIYFCLQTAACVLRPSVLVSRSYTIAHIISDAEVYT